MTDEQIKEAAFEFSIDYKPFETDLEYREYFKEGFNKGAKWHRDQSQWIPVSERLPLAIELGSWDGRRSDKILVHTKDDRYFVAVLYEGIMDGNEFHDFYDDRDFEIKDVEYWKEI